MSNTKTVMGQASNQYVVPTDITDVFSTYLYTGTGSAQTITNDIDLNGKGGMVWIKGRNAVSNHALIDTERGGANSIASDTTDAQRTDGAYGLTFNSNGFDSTGGNLNVSGREQASWTFRKAPKFFDVIKYSGDSNATRSIPHGLGSSVGMIIIKTLNANDNWFVYHRGLPNGLGTGRLKLNNTNAVDGTTNFLSADSSSVTFASNAGGNYSGNEYVMYLFAHNDGDGGFGPSGDQDIIKCGSYTGNGSTNGTEVNLGWEPQWLLVKEASPGTSNWMLVDNMRGVPTGGNTAQVQPNTSNAETAAQGQLDFTATGFKLTHATSYNTSGDTYIYMAIRRGPLAQPESGTEVFDIATRGAVSGEPGFRSDTGVVDMALVKTVNTSSDWSAKSRLTQGKYLVTNSSAAETSLSYAMFDYMNGHSAFDGTNSNTHSWMWKRAPGFFDVVAYTGTNVAGLTINHNLGVVPEMIWVKNRSAAEYWAVYHKDLNGGTNPSHYFLRLNTTNAETDYNEIWNDTEPTATQFTVGQQGVVNGFEQNHIAYLFATLPGVSKVGSFTHSNGSNTTVDCGFTSGARFVLVKQTDLADGWFVFDTERGITVSDSPRLFLNSTASEVGSSYIEPASSGFIIKNGFWSAGDYIFYAIA